MLSATLCRVQSAMNELGLPAAVVSQLVTGLSTSRLLAALRDQYVGGLGGPLEAELLTKLARVKQYADALTPLPLPASADTLRRLLKSPLSPDEVREMVGQIFGTRTLPVDITVDAIKKASAEQIRIWTHKYGQAVNDRLAGLS